MKTTRFVRYDDDDKRLYLDFYERKDRDRNKKSRVFVYIHGGGWIGGLPETREAYTTKLCEKRVISWQVCTMAKRLFTDIPK